MNKDTIASKINKDENNDIVLLTNDENYITINDNKDLTTDEINEKYIFGRVIYIIILSLLFGYLIRLIILLIQ